MVKLDISCEIARIRAKEVLGKAKGGTARAIKEVIKGNVTTAGK